MSCVQTCCADHFYRMIQLSDGSLINCQIYDTLGQEKYTSIIESYYRKADAALLVYDISNKKSFEKIKNYYIEAINENCKKDIPIILLGNKADLENEREISKEEGMLLAKQENYEFDECSCLKNINVASAFETLLERWNFERHKEKQKDLAFRKSAKIKKKKFQRSVTEYNLEIEDDIEYNTEGSRYNSMAVNSEKKGNIKLKINGQKKRKKKCCK